MSNLSESDQKDMAQKLATGGPQPGEIYRHYKGDLYVIICRSIKEDTLEQLVTYRSNAKSTYWTRTVENFTETVSYAADNPSGPCPRFRRVPD
jgi:hypothetical protein